MVDWKFLLAAFLRAWSQSLIEKEVPLIRILHYQLSELVHILMRGFLKQMKRERTGK